MAIPDASILQVVVNLLLPSSVIAQNVFHVSFIGEATSNDEPDVISDLEDWIDALYTLWASIGDSNISLGAIDCYVRDTADDDWDNFGTGTSAVTGAVSGEMLPHAVAGYTRALTNSPEVIAKKYWPGITEASQAEGTWAAATVTQMIAMNDEWTDTFTGSATGSLFVPGCWSPKNNQFYFFTGGHITSAIPAYQRRRKPGVGI